MNFSNILNNLAGGVGGGQGAAASMSDSLRNVSGGISKNMPGGLAGGAVAGGLVALLVGNKSARKTAGKAAKYGGAALLGGLAYKAYKGWQQNNSTQAVSEQAQGSFSQTASYAQPNTLGADAYQQEALEHMNGNEPDRFLQVALIKAMIAAARADGQIDSKEQSRISDAIEKMAVDGAAKSELLELFLKPLTVDDVVIGLDSLEQKAEVYLASCLAIDLDESAEYAYLGDLSRALDLPPGLEHQLREQAANAVADNA